MEKQQLSKFEQAYFFNTYRRQVQDKAYMSYYKKEYEQTKKNKAITNNK